MNKYDCTSGAGDRYQGQGIWPKKGTRDKGYGEKQAGIWKF